MASNTSLLNLQFKNYCSILRFSIPKAQRVHSFNWCMKLVPSLWLCSWAELERAKINTTVLFRPYCKPKLGRRMGVYCITIFPPEHRHCIISLQGFDWSNAHYPGGLSYCWRKVTKQTSRLTTWARDQYLVNNAQPNTVKYQGWLKRCEAQICDSRHAESPK